MLWHATKRTFNPVFLDPVGVKGMLCPLSSIHRLQVLQPQPGCEL